MARVVKRKAKAGRKLEARGQSWLAVQLQCTQQRVSQLIGREGWRWPKRNWSDAEVAKIKAWHAGLREENPATADAAQSSSTSSPAVVGVNPLSVGGDALLLGDITDPQALLKLVEKPGERLKLMGVIERAAKVRLDRELLLGGYVKKEEVEAERVKRVQAVRQELSNVRLLALKMEGMPVADMERVLEDWARELCRKFEGTQAS